LTASPGLLEYKPEEYGILVDCVDEENTSETCSCCGQIRDSNRVERGLYVCESYETTMNADVNSAVHIRRKITQTPPTGDMSNGWLAQPGVFLFDREVVQHETTGRLQPSNPTARDSAIARVRLACRHTA
jgi:hypothetical protein